MKQKPTPAENRGTEPLDVEKHDQESADKADKKIKKDDVTGQTASTLKEMKSRLKEVPHKSAASKHDAEQHDK